MGKQSQLLLQPTEVELGLQVGVEFDKMISPRIIGHLKRVTVSILLALARCHISKLLAFTSSHVSIICKYDVKWMSKDG